MIFRHHTGRPLAALAAVAATTFSAAVMAAATFAGLVCAGVAQAGEPVLPGRPIASRVGEPGGIAQLQGRIDALGAEGSGDCDASYETHKAQAWLNFAKYAVQNEAPSPVKAAALRQADAIVSGLETHATLSSQTPELPGAHHVRDDLWRAVAGVKADGRRCAAPKMTAYCEVQLAWVDYEASEGGWRHIDPYVRIAEDYCAVAVAAIPLPAAPLSAVKTGVLTQEQVDRAEAPPEFTAAAPEGVPAVEHIDVSTYVLFPHDRAGRDDIRSPGREQLAALARYLRSLPADTLITVVGHADLTGRPSYNQALSARRARSVAAELAQFGVAPRRIHVGAVGSREPVVTCKRNRDYLACLEPNRRVVVHLVATGS